MGSQREEFQSDAVPEYLPEMSTEHPSEILEAVLRETIDELSRDSLELVMQVAKSSNQQTANSLQAVQEIVERVVSQRLKLPGIPRSMARNIAQAILETPEAAEKLDRIWQEARARE